MSQKILYRLIDTAGQITAVVTTKINMEDLPKLAKSIMEKDQKVEQVGYLRGDNFQMMGGELSINGLLASAFIRNPSTTCITLPSSLILDTSGDIVSLKGITYKITNNLPASKRISFTTKKLLTTLASGTKASGIIYYKNNTIKPLVYVSDTNTYVWENACGSGSLAYSLVTGNRKVIQPSGKLLKFKISKNTITVTATVKEI